MKNSRSLRGFSYAQSLGMLDEVWTGNNIRIFFETDGSDERTGFNFTVATDHEVTVSIYDWNY